MQKQDIPALAPSPDGLHLASPVIFISKDVENESIYQDEIEDGLANAATEQAKLWATAAKEGPKEGEERSAVIDSTFVLELLNIPQLLRQNLGNEMYNNSKFVQQRQKLLDNTMEARIFAEMRSGSERRIRLLNKAREAAEKIRQKRMVSDLQRMEAERSSGTTTVVAKPAVAPPPKMEKKEEEVKEAKGKEKKPEVICSPSPAGKDREVALTQSSPDTNVVCVSLGEILSPNNKNFQSMTGDPIHCSSCNAALNTWSPLTKSTDLKVSEDRSLWVCEFCGEKNAIRVEKEEIPINGSPADYLLEPSLEAAVQPLIIFCIDISGSMCVTTEVDANAVKLPPALNALLQKEKAELQQFIEGNASQWFPRQKQNVQYISRLQCVQTAVHAQMQMLAAESPNTRVALITFNSDVTLYGDGSDTPCTVTGDMLNDLEGLFSKGVAYAHTKLAVSQSNKKLADKIYELEPRGATALGPALVLAAGIASKEKQSRIVLCTDGKANVGLGNVEAIPGGAKGKSEAALKAAAEVEAFYRGIGKRAAGAGTSISVISIRGDDCSMENLGLLADSTQGQVNIVDPLELEKNFLSILSKPTLARSVVCSVLLPRTFGVKETKDQSVLTREIGNVLGDTDLTFAFAPLKSSASPIPATIPLQVQVRYTKLDGTKCLRTVTRLLPTSTNRDKTEETVDTGVVSVHAVRKSAGLAHAGDYKTARVNLISTQRLLQRIMKKRDHQRDYMRFIIQGEKLDGFMRIAQQQEQLAGLDEELRKAARNDANSKAIYNMKSLSLLAFKQLLS